jgi:hypothetical protein
MTKMKFHLHPADKSENPCQGIILFRIQESVTCFVNVAEGDCGIDVAKIDSNEVCGIMSTKKCHFSNRWTYLDITFAEY